MQWACFCLMDRKKINVGKYALVFFLTTFIFLGGIFTGNYVSDRKLSNLNQMEQDIKVQTMAIELQYELLSESPCDVINSTPLTEELYELSDRLNYMEANLGFNHPIVLRLKEYYSLLELRQWMFLKRTNEQCDRNNILILYFYSNRGNCDNCEEQGYVLTYIRNKHSNTKVYTFDINIDNIALRTIKDIYIKSEELPVIIVNDKIYYGFKNREQIEDIITMNSKHK